MGLKQTPPGEGDPAAVVAPSVAPKAAAPEPTPAPPPAKETEKKKDRLVLLAVKRPISDPTTGVTYDLNHPKPADRWPGNWIDCQMNVGILVEYTGPKVE